MQYHQKYSDMRICHFNMTNIESVIDVESEVENTQFDAILQFFCAGFYEILFCLGGQYYTFCKTNT